MVIDFHTHVFPDRIAPKALSFLSENCGQQPAFDGTACGLLAQMEESGIDVSVVLPVLTDPRQFGSAFRFAVKINDLEQIFDGLNEGQQKKVLQTKLLVYRISYCFCLF